MFYKRLIFNFWVFSITLGLCGCLSTQPYIYNPNEFNRAAKDFGKRPADRSEVKICHSERSTNPQIVVKMANQECGHYGKVARFYEQDYLVCPLTTPVGAMFKCEQKRK